MSTKIKIPRARIDRNWLIANDACEEGMRQFLLVFPRGLKFTEANLRRAWKYPSLREHFPWLLGLIDEAKSDEIAWRPGTEAKYFRDAFDELVKLAKENRPTRKGKVAHA